MAQLSDDCFAFGGALLPVAEMERLIARARRAGDRDRERAACCGARPRHCAGCRRADRSSTVRQFGGRRLRGAPRRPRGRGRHPAQDRRSRHRRPRRDPRARRGRSDPHFHRRADAGRRRYRVHAGGHPRRRRCGDRAAGPEARRQQPRRRRGPAREHGHAAGRPAPHHRACRARRRRRPHHLAGAPQGAGRGVLDRRRDRRTRHAVAAGGAVRR